MGQRLLLRWAEEQWAGSLQRMQAAEGALDKLKTAAKAAALKMKDTRFTLEVLHLCSGRTHLDCTVQKSVSAYAACCCAHLGLIT